jgi:predicted peroxiredoxin
MNKRNYAALVLGVSLLAPLAVQAADHEHTGDKALIMVNSESLMTQGMAMVLGNAMQGQGVQVDVLLCDQAADLALQETTSAELKPNDVTPEQLLMKLQQGGASVSVCALYLPNSGNDKDALREGVEVAAPPAIAEKMMATDTRVFSF